jgi:hypothetical protein
MKKILCWNYWLGISEKYVKWKTTLNWGKLNGGSTVLYTEAWSPWADFYAGRLVHFATNPTFILMRVKSNQIFIEGFQGRKQFENHSSTYLQHKELSNILHYMGLKIPHIPMCILLAKSILFQNVLCFEYLSN